MEKQVVEKIRREINSVEDLVHHLKKEQESYFFNSCEMKFTDEGIVIKNYDGIFLIENIYLKKAYELLKFYVEFADYIYSLKKGDKIIVSTSAGKNEAIVKRINRTRDNEIKSITIEIIYQNGFKSEDKVEIKSLSSHCRIEYKGLILQDLEKVVKNFVNYVSSLPVSPNITVLRIDKLYNSLMKQDN